MAASGSFYAVSPSESDSDGSELDYPFEENHSELMPIDIATLAEKDADANQAHDNQIISRPIGELTILFRAYEQMEERVQHLEKYQKKILKRNQEEKNPMETIEDILRCLICLDRVKNAQMCPSCSKICCDRCIRKWITQQKPQCPHCRNTLFEEQLIPCRFFENVSLQLDRLSKKSVKEKRYVSKEDECHLHGAPMSYYCQEDRAAICSDCAIFDKVHHGHTFKQLKEVYQSHVQRVKGEAKSAKKRLKELNAVLEAVCTNLNSIDRAKNERLSELNSFTAQMITKLESQLEGKTGSLKLHKEQLEADVDSIEEVLTLVKTRLNHPRKREFIERSEELINVIHETCSKLSAPKSAYAVPAQFDMDNIVPPYESKVFKLKNYTKLTDEVVYSDTLISNGMTWRLKIYPNGNGLARGSYVSVFMEQLKGLREPAKYDYKVEMINHRKPDQNVVREFSSEFQEGECWGYNRFYQIEQIRQEGFISDDSDQCVTLRFHVRPPNVFQLCRDQQRHILNMEAERVQSNQREEELKSQVEELNRMLAISNAPVSDVNTDNVPTDPNLTRRTSRASMIRMALSDPNISRNLQQFPTRSDANVYNFGSPTVAMLYGGNFIPVSNNPTFQNFGSFSDPSNLFSNLNINYHNLMGHSTVDAPSHFPNIAPVPTKLPGADIANNSTPYASPAEHPFVPQNTSPGLEILQSIGAVPDSPSLLAEPPIVDLERDSGPLKTTPALAGMSIEWLEEEEENTAEDQGEEKMNGEIEGQAEEWSDPNDHLRLYVHHVPNDVAEDDLFSFLNTSMSNLGINPQHTQAIVDKRSEGGRGVVLEFRRPEDATAAMAMDGLRLKSSTLEIRRPRGYREDHNQEESPEDDESNPDHSMNFLMEGTDNAAEGTDYERFSQVVDDDMDEDEESSSDEQNVPEDAWRYRSQGDFVNNYKTPPERSASRRNSQDPCREEDFQRDEGGDQDQTEESDLSDGDL
ncbi:hypothetical protein PROFUN_05484 [Planoprotostelium fungivorum]|uniref:E3 ubiquitin-protein ligase TRIM37-like n=1 Tax=Planoprotostelium fungivorum TaxID=1890364 RepID=A0A2P6NQV5_9EUKA|nr:hypothetical protein PROFUN_05484 [Planoprotostelium fungivorum]